MPRVGAVTGQSSPLRRSPTMRPLPQAKVFFSFAIGKMVTLENLGEKMDTLDNSLGTKMDDLGNSLGTKMDDLGNSLGTKMDDLGKKMDDLGKKMDDLGKKMDDLGTKIDRGFLELQKTIALISEYESFLNDTLCPICLEVLGEGRSDAPVAKSSCHHHLHVYCITSHSEEKCPLCMTDRPHWYEISWFLRGSANGSCYRYQGDMA